MTDTEPHIFLNMLVASILTVVYLSPSWHFSTSLMQYSGRYQVETSLSSTLSAVVSTLLARKQQWGITLYSAVCLYHTLLKQYSILGTLCYIAMAIGLVGYSQTLNFCRVNCRFGLLLSFKSQKE